MGENVTVIGDQEPIPDNQATILIAAHQAAIPSNKDGLRAELREISANQKKILII